MQAKRWTVKALKTELKKIHMRQENAKFEEVIKQAEETLNAYWNRMDGLLSYILLRRNDAD